MNIARMSSKIIALLLSISLLITISPAFAAVSENVESKAEQIPFLKPIKSVYYGGHTYSMFSIPNMGWDAQENFCRALGDLAGVPAHLAVISSSGENSALFNGGLSGVIGASESGGIWTWVDGTMLGKQQECIILDEDGNPKPDFFYTPIGYDNWSRKNWREDVPYSGHEKREPDSFVPYLGQNKAYMNPEHGDWNNNPESPGSPFICEFEGTVAYMYAVMNQNLDYTVNDQTIYYLDAPGVYADIVTSAGKFMVPRPMQREKLAGALKKQPIDKYPIHPDKHYNFLGWAYKNGNNHPLWDYNSADPVTYADFSPEIVLYAAWEDADKAELSDVQKFAASVFCYGVSFGAEFNFKGKTVSEAMNAVSGKGMFIPEVLNRVKASGNKNINNLDLIHATLGGFRIRALTAAPADNVKDVNGESFFAIQFENNTGTNIIDFRGTDFLNKDSVGMDFSFGAWGELDSPQFGKALTFFDANSDSKTILTGHSLGGGLATYVSLLRNVPNYTMNSTDGFVIPIIISEKYTEIDFRGVEQFDELLHPFVDSSDVLVGMHSTDSRTHYLIPSSFLGSAFVAHVVESSIVYKNDGVRANNPFDIAPYEKVVHNKPWVQKRGVMDFRIVYLGTTGNDEILGADMFIIDAPILLPIYLFGGDGDDTLTGGVWKDILVGGRGNNTLSGEGGDDLYIIQGNPGATTRIHDPKPGKNKIRLINVSVTENASSKNNYTMLLSDGQKIILDVETLENMEIEVINTQPENPVPTPLIAKPTTSDVLVNGKSIAFDAYNIGGNNYFKLRDLAFALSGSKKQFEVGWDGSNNSIALTSGMPYTAVGGEMASKGSGEKTPTPTSSKITVDGNTVPFTAYNIDGNNYFKLRDIGQVFDFSVTWDGSKNTIMIDTSKSYSPD